MYTCIDCKREFKSHIGFLNHLHQSKEPSWYLQEQEFYKEVFAKYNLDAEFIEYISSEGCIRYHCNLSGQDVYCYYDKLRRNGLCQCKQCQFKHKSEASKRHWANDNGEHGKAISEALMKNQHHREESSKRFIKMAIDQQGHQPWSSYEKEISDYLNSKGIKHDCNSVILHLDGTTKNYVYDIYLPNHNLLIELNDRHFNDKLYTMKEAEDIPFKTYREEAIHDRLKYDLAISKGYNCMFFFDLDDCKKFIDKL